VGGRYLARRLLLFPPTLVGASILIFVLLRLVPGDIAEILVYQTGSESSVVQQKQIRQLRGTTIMSPSDAKIVKKWMPYG